MTTKNAPASAATGREGLTPMEGINLMDNVHPINDAVTALSARIDSVKASIEELISLRETLMEDSLAELVAAGIPAEIVKLDRGGQYSAGDSCLLQATYEYHGGRTSVKRDLLDSSCLDRMSLGPRLWARWEDWVSVFDVVSPCEVLLVDEDKALIVRDAWRPDIARDGHRRAMARLRTAARAEGFKVRTRDGAVSVVDPFNTVVHTGTISSAMCWVVGIDLALSNAQEKAA